MKRPWLFIVFLVIIMLYIWIFSDPTLYVELLKLFNKIQTKIK